MKWKKKMIAPVAALAIMGSVMLPVGAQATTNFEALDYENTDTESSAMTPVVNDDSSGLMAARAAKKITCTSKVKAVSSFWNGKNGLATSSSTSQMNLTAQVRIFKSNGAQMASKKESLNNTTYLSASKNMPVGLVL